MLNFDYIANPTKNKYIINLFCKSALDGYNSNSSHQLGLRAKNTLETSADIIKSIFPYKNVEFVPGGGTLANKRAIIDSIPIKPKRLNKDTRKDIVLISCIEHKSIIKIIPIELKIRGYHIVYIPVNRKGYINIEEYTKILKMYNERIALVSVHYVNNEIGTIQPINEIVKLSQSYDIIVHSDIAQGIYIFLEQTDNLPNIVTFSCYKLGGTYCGIVISNVKLNVNYFGTPDTATIYSAAHAVKLYVENKDYFVKRCNEMKNIITEKLDMLFSYLNIKVINLSKESIPNLISYLFPIGYQSSIIVNNLSELGIYIGAGSACASTSKTGSYVIKELGYTDDACFGSIRISFSPKQYNDIDKLVDGFYRVMAKLRKIVIPVKKHIYNPVKHNYKIKESNAVEPVKYTEEVKYDDITYNSIKICMGELCVKGKNKQDFINMLKKHIASKLDINDKLYKNNLTFILNTNNVDRILERIKYIPGISLLKIGINGSKMDLDTIKSTICSLLYKKYKEINKQVKFKIDTRFNNIQKYKNMSKSKCNYLFGQCVVDTFKDKCHVDLSYPDICIGVELTKLYSFIYYETIKGNEGLPAGSNGTVLCNITEKNIVRSLYSCYKIISRGLKVHICSTIPDKLIKVKDILNKFQIETVFVKDSSLNKYKGIICEPDDDIIIDSNFIVNNAKDIQSLTMTENPKHIYDTVVSIGYNVEYNLKNNIVDKKRNVLLLLSGGIDSPVAGYILGKYGFIVHYIHFTTNVDKIDNIKKIVDTLDSKGNLYIYKFLELQEKVALNCKSSYRTILYKVLMIIIANEYAIKNNIDMIATGNAWGQVASQTSTNLLASESFSTLPIYSPLLCYNKKSIIDIARDIGTYESSICDGTDDCCKMWMPKAPVLNASIDIIEKYVKKIYPSFYD